MRFQYKRLQRASTAAKMVAKRSKIMKNGKNQVLRRSQIGIWLQIDRIDKSVLPAPEPKMGPKWSKNAVFEGVFEQMGLETCHTRPKQTSKNTKNRKNRKK